MKIKQLIAIAFIIACSTVAWFLLGTAMVQRTYHSQTTLSQTVEGNWGAPLNQPHPSVYYEAPNATRTKRYLQPESSAIQIDLSYQPKKKGLLWYQTYAAKFTANYQIKNPSPITQTIYFSFTLPEGTKCDGFTLASSGKTSRNEPVGRTFTEALVLAAGAAEEVTVSYNAVGQTNWTYDLSQLSRIRNVDLIMSTNFEDIDFPADSSSALERQQNSATNGWNLQWKYSDVIGIRTIGMAMPKVLNPGPVASRIAFFAPISLVFFFAVLIVLTMVKKVALHPMNYFFLSAGCFAFQLLFAYLLDQLSIHLAFGIAAGVSLILVTGYLKLVAGWAFARISALAQLAYMILFSYSFFHDGFTGLTITIGAIVTLALLMAFTAKMNWSAIFAPAPPQAQS